MAEQKRGRVKRPAPDERQAGLREALDALPRLRLTGEQLDVDLHADEFAVDWDEYDEFVRLDDVRAALAAAQPEVPTLDADRHLPDCDAPYDGEPCTCVSRAEALAVAQVPAQGGPTEAVHAALLMLLQKQPRALAAEQFIRWLAQDGYTVTPLVPAQEERLDVERLARAMSDHENAKAALGYAYHDCDFGCARDIAAEYRALAIPSAQETDHD